MIDLLTQRGEDEERNYPDYQNWYGPISVNAS